MANVAGKYICYLCCKKTDHTQIQSEIEGCPRKENNGLHLWLNYKRLPKQLSRNIKNRHKNNIKFSSKEIYYIANYYEKEKDFANAVKWYEKAATLGNPQAMLALGEIYRDDRCGMRNVAKAVECYEKAAKFEKLNSSAVLFLGRTYEMGDGIVPNTEKSKFWYNEFANAEVKIPPSLNPTPYFIGGCVGGICYDGIKYDWSNIEIPNFENLTWEASIIVISHIIEELKKSFNDREHYIVPIAKQKSDNLVSVDLKIYHEDNGKWYENVLEGNFRIENIPQSICDKVIKSTEEIDITDDLNKYNIILDRGFPNEKIQLNQGFCDFFKKET